MAVHLRFDAKTGRVEPRTAHGTHTVELLQLNDDATIQYRRGALKTVQLFFAEIANLKEQQREVAARLQRGQISQAVHDQEIDAINEGLAELQRTVDEVTGELALPPLPRQRNGLALLVEP